MLVSIKMGELDTTGVWAKFSDGVEFRIARAGNPNFQKASDKMEAPYRKQIARGKLPTGKQVELQCAAMAEGILLDWKGLATEEGELLYSKENAAAVLRYNSEIREFVFEFATDQENFRTEMVEDTAKK